MRLFAARRSGSISARRSARPSTSASSSAGGHRLQHQPDLRGLAARHGVAGQGQPLGPLRPHVVEPQVVGQRAEVARGREAEGRVVGGDHHVAQKCDVGAAGQAEAVDLREHRLVHVEERHAQPLRALELPRVVVEAARAAVAGAAALAAAARRLGEVVARAEARARAAHDHGVDLAVGVGVPERLVQLLEQLQRQGVALLGPVQGDAGAPALDLDGDLRVGHAALRSRPAPTPARRPTRGAPPRTARARSRCARRRSRWCDPRRCSAPRAARAGRGIAALREGEPGVHHALRQRVGRGPAAREVGHSRIVVRAEHEAQLERVAGADQPAHHRRAPGEQVAVDARIVRGLGLGQAQARHAEDPVGLDRRPELGAGDRVAALAARLAVRLDERARTGAHPALRSARARSPR